MRAVGAHPLVRLRGRAPALALLLAAAAPAPVALPNMPDWYEPSEPLRIVGPIHWVGTKELGVYLITTPAGHILLDGTMPRSAPLIEASIKKLGFDPGDIRWLLISHAHKDHVGTLAHVKKATGAKLAVMGADIGLLKSGGTTDYLFSNSKDFHFDPVEVDRVLKDGDTVALGGVTLTARATPGHTPGCTTWTTTVEDGGRRYDVVFAGSISVNPGTRLVRDPSYPGILDDYRRSIALLESLKPDIFLAAHAGFFDLDAKRERAKKEGAKAFVDPAGFRKWVADAKAKIEKLAAEETR
ncbi:MAG TPA: subclass B3 metallo-beta-lactamase [Candidatus Polarisedimenticolaceae bacterium]|nr:subclass B3 metallo-beta-lactamase [Candidatus Polarisedimenticolaceae bacterium]